MSRKNNLKFDYYQLRDADGNEFGILHTNAPSDVVQGMWQRYYTNQDVDVSGFEYNSEDLSTDNFSDLLIALGYDASCIYLEDINA